MWFELTHAMRYCLLSIWELSVIRFDLEMGEQLGIVSRETVEGNDEKAISTLTLELQCNCWDKSHIFYIK
jgi:hypothetical protein